MILIGWLGHKNLNSVNQANMSFALDPNDNYIKKDVLYYMCK